MPWSPEYNSSRHNLKKKTVYKQNEQLRIELEEMVARLLHYEL